MNAIRVAAVVSEPASRREPAVYPARSSEKPSTSCALTRSTQKQGWRVISYEKQLESRRTNLRSPRFYGLFDIHPMSNVEIFFLCVQTLTVCTHWEHEIRQIPQNRKQINDNSDAIPRDLAKFLETMEQLLQFWIVDG